MTTRPSNLICNPSLERSSLGIHCNASSLLIYRAGTCPPVCRRAIVQPVPLMTNPRSLTMGFAGDDPRQCAAFSLFIFLFLFFYFFVFFWWPQWLFLFNSHLSTLGSYDFCPLWDLFLTLGATLHILQEYRRSFTLYKGTHIKKM